MTIDTNIRPEKQLGQDELQLIADHQPMERSEQSLMQAAIAIILRDSKRGTEFLLMQRAIHERDPWSGQMAFPGGKVESTDESAMAAAIRETEEEVGLRLFEHDYIGRLDDLYGLKVDNQYSVHVACFVFKLSGEYELRGNYEVADMVWMPFSYLDDPDNAVDFYHPHDEKIKMPAVLIDADKEQVLWGLSLRMLSTLFELLDWPLRVLSERENQALRQMESRNLTASDPDQARSKKMLQYLQRINRRN